MKIIATVCEDNVKQLRRYVKTIMTVCETFAIGLGQYVKLFRPIVVSGLLRRLASKIAVKSVMSEVGPYLLPL